MAYSSKRIVCAGSLCAAGLFAAWLGLRATLAHEGRFTDGQALYRPGADGTVRYAVWESPRALPATLNSPAAETHPALTSDGRAIVFAVGERGLGMDLYLAELGADAFAEPRPIEALNTGADECAPTMYGDELYFASDRAGGAGGLDLYHARWDGTAFSAPERLPESINSPADDCDAAPRPGTDEIVFASNRGAAGFDLYVAGPADATPQRLSLLDTASDERDPAFSPDGRALLFASDREHAGSFDLWRSFAGADGWLAPVTLDGLNSTASERGPCSTPDGFTLYFTREAAESPADLMRACTVELYQLPAATLSWVELSVLGALLALALMALLAERWPALEPIYKCFLVSVLLHLAILWWFHGVLFEGSGPPSRDRADRYRVRVLAPNTERLTEHGGQLRTERTSNEGAETMLARAALALPSDAAPAPPGAAIAEALFGPAEQVAPAPARAPSGLAPEPRAASAAVELHDDAGGPERRAGAARELALAPAAGGGAAPERNGGELARAQFAPGGASDDAAPTSHIDVALAPAPGASAPARTAVSAAEGLRASSDAPAPALAMPSDTADTGTASARRSGSAPEFVLGTHDGLEMRGGRGQRSADEQSPERLNGAGDSARVGAGGANASPGPLALSSLSPGAPAFAPSSGPRERAAASLDPLGAAHNPLVMQDREAPATRIGGTRDASGTSTESDLLATLAPQTAGRSERATAGNGSSMSSSGPAHFAAPDARADSAPAFELPIAPPPAERDLPTVPRTSWEHTPYQNRAGEEKARALELHGGSAQTEQAVERGLAYLARIQRPGGEWGDLDALDEKYGQVAVGKTGLALLAFLGAGHTHVSGTLHAPVVQRALDALLALQDQASGHFGDTSAYSHGIATFALAECLALSGDERLRAPLQTAVAHILARQSRKRDPRFFGGWGYFYADERTFDRWPRTSITVWQVMALESARLSGVDVPDSAFEAARAFLENARDEDGEYYRYNHDPERLASGYPTLPASTPAALFALSLLGEDIQTPAHAPQRAFVLNRAPRGYRYTSDEAFVHDAQGNLYFWYYATLAMFRTGGGAWATWNEAMKQTLLPAQQPDGSWRPIDVYARYARDNESDRSYTTTMCVLSLEIYYRYFLPLLKVR